PPADGWSICDFIKFCSFTIKSIYQFSSFNLRLLAGAPVPSYRKTDTDISFELLILIELSNIPNSFFFNNFSSLDFAQYPVSNFSQSWVVWLINTCFPRSCACFVMDST